MRAQKVRSMRYRDLPDDDKSIIDEEAAGYRTIPRKPSPSETQRRDGIGQPIAEGTA